MVLSALALCTFLQPAMAGDSARTEQTDVRLMSAVTATGDLKNVPLGVSIAMKPGWKTYWRSPGDAGFAPSIDISGSTNVAALGIAYPVPHRFELFGLQTFGYGEEVVFPLTLTVANPGAPVSLHARLRYLVCEQVCIPYEHDLSLDLPAGPAQVSNDAALISRFQALVPDAGARARFALTGLTVAGETLSVTLRSDGLPFAKPDAVVEAPSGLYFDKPKVELLGDGHEARLSLPIQRDPGGPDPASTALTLTVFDGMRALEQKIVPALFAAPAGGVQATQPATNLGPMLLVALLGGLILNVMPCVLPVLLLKLSHVLESAGAARNHLRASFVASAAGIVTAFGVLAGILIAIKAGGATIGWGIQFQQPLFLGALALLCLVLAANTWGWFQIQVPAIAGALGNLTDRAEPRRPLLASFLSGVLATILATPCSAPFVGTAVGFALARGPQEIALIFIALGTGLALPYLAIAAMPGLVAWLPRPGAWMLWLKRALGLSLAATGLWLGFILAQQTGLLAATQRADGIAWTKFDAAAIPGLVAEGKVVFVDVTAEWCLTCKANKEFVLTKAPVAGALGETMPMLADWTRPNPAISAYLAEFGRFGIPMNVVYGPKAPQGILLPELLSSDDVMTALKQAK
ncbi:protein-disulfide reductase DsbD domain-containing protein [Dongia rigui]|uniref:Protein-disulfide reductase DsbD family protein n=1 Tax=Dongia rigui TaxID=940149 RepID=A0ABU5DW04_9PROT|nr:protein-disulfide reductase DsbD domain-containing protein [Dongia rigui]MDY0871393.1 protein-disulfide reductase DsbD family protein [Dongia rigui]